MMPTLITNSLAYTFDLVSIEMKLLSHLASAVGCLPTN